MSDLETAARVLESYRDEVYPSDIFAPIPDEILPEIDAWLLEQHGRRIDGVSAFYYRRVLTLAARVLRDLQADLDLEPELSGILTATMRADIAAAQHPTTSPETGENEETA